MTIATIDYNTMITVRTRPSKAWYRYERTARISLFRITDVLVVVPVVVIVVDSTGVYVVVAANV